MYSGAEASLFAATQCRNCAGRRGTGITRKEGFFEDGLDSTRLEDGIWKERAGGTGEEKRNIHMSGFVGLHE